MEEQILIVDLYFSEKALYIVIFLVSFKPLNIQHIKSNLFFLPVVIQSPVADGNLGSGLSWLMKQQYFILWKIISSNFQIFLKDLIHPREN